MYKIEKFPFEVLPETQFIKFLGPIRVYPTSSGITLDSAVKNES